GERLAAVVGLGMAVGRVLDDDAVLGDEDDGAGVPVGRPGPEAGGDDVVDGGERRAVEAYLLGHPGAQGGEGGSAGAVGDVDRQLELQLPELLAQPGAAAGSPAEPLVEG